MLSPKISVVIPIYNGSKYLRKTLDSIVKNTFDSYEVLCVNDCSTDDSVSIVREYTQKDSRFKLITTKINLGIVPKVMNFVKPHINGDYFVYSSQDDIVSEDWLSSMYFRAIETGADAVVPNLVFYYEDQPSKNRILSGLMGDKKVILSGREALTYSLDWTIPGNALWSMRLFHKFSYFDFGMNADEFTVRVFYLNCNKVVFSDGIFYYRQDNPNAITKKLSIKSFDIPYTNFKIFFLLKQNNFSIELQNKYLLNAINSLIYFNSLCFFEKDFKPARIKIKACFEEFLLNKSYDFMKEKSYTSLKIWLLRQAASNYAAFEFLSYLFAIKRIALTIIK
jgi:glycosyltransferase involved in cell wall biosynthesis